MTLKKGKTVMLLVGEASGDFHGANLVKAIRELDGTLSFLGTGGKALKKEGVETFFDIRSLSVMGLTEVVSKLHLVLKALHNAKRLLKERRPDLLILIDFPEFNLNVAKAAKKYGIPVLYYISPKVWAWRSNRVKIIQKRVDRMAIILPFEREFYSRHDIPVTYVGHPLMDVRLFQHAEKPDKKKKGETIIAVLPGSREKEILGLLPVMMASARLLSNKLNNLTFLISVAPSIDRCLVDDVVTPYRSELQFEVISDSVYDIFSVADFAMAASGTVNLEAAIAGIPMVVLYKMSALSYFLAEHLVKLEHASLVNLIAGKEVVPELLQKEANPEKIADTVHRILTDDNILDQMKKELAHVKSVLGGPGASHRVARIALEMMA